MTTEDSSPNLAAGSSGKSSQTRNEPSGEHTRGRRPGLRVKLDSIPERRVSDAPAAAGSSLDLNNPTVEMKAVDFAFDPLDDSLDEVTQEQDVEEFRKTVRSDTSAPHMRGITLPKDLASTDKEVSDEEETVRVDPPSDVLMRSAESETRDIEIDEELQDELELDMSDAEQLSDDELEREGIEVESRGANSSKVEGALFDEDDDEEFVLSAVDIEIEPEKTPPEQQAQIRPSLIPKFDLEEENPWYEDFFESSFHATTVPIPPEIVTRECDAISHLLELTQPVSMLDVGCGSAAHATEFAVRGHRVTGLDMSKTMLGFARNEASDRNAEVDFVQQDMRELSYREEFDAIVCWNTTFGYFSDEGNMDVLRRMADALKKGGRLLLGVPNRDYVLRTQPASNWYNGPGNICIEESKFDTYRSRLEVTRVVKDSGQPEAAYSIRVYAPHELGKMMEDVGLKTESLTGNRITPGIFFGPDSSEIIIVARKPSD